MGNYLRTTRTNVEGVRTQRDVFMVNSFKTGTPLRVTLNGRVRESSLRLALMSKGEFYWIRGICPPTPPLNQR